jgi:hypothetical protein
MFAINHRGTAGLLLGGVAVTIAIVGFTSPTATGVGGSSGGDGAPQSSPRSQGSDPEDRVLRTVVRVERTFRVRPHSLATNELLRCPGGTLLTGGGTSLIGEPNGRPGNAPILYTNGPVGNILPGEQQTWAAEVANRSGQTFSYREFALCATTRSVPFDEDDNDD